MTCSKYELRSKGSLGNRVCEIVRVWEIVISRHCFLYSEDLNYQFIERKDFRSVLSIERFSLHHINRFLAKEQHTSSCLKTFFGHGITYLYLSFFYHLT